MMSRDQSPSGGYRNDGLRSERDPAMDEGGSRPEGDAGRQPGDMARDAYGQNEMSKAWARESYRADYGRISRETRNDFGTRRVDHVEEPRKPD
nr:hypothetical protein REQ54_00204 [Rhizobium sp. Q54]